MHLLYAGRKLLNLDLEAAGDPGRRPLAERIEHSVADAFEAFAETGVHTLGEHRADDESVLMPSHEVGLTNGTPERVKHSAGIARLESNRHPIAFPQFHEE